MTDEPNKQPEHKTCESCGREFVVDTETVGDPSYLQFCPDCLSPYLLEEQNATH